MKIVNFAIFLLSILLFGCTEQQQGNTSRMSEEDKAALKGAIAVEMIKQGNKEEGRKLFKEGMDDWMRAQKKK